MTKRIVNREVLRSKIALHNIKTKEMCNLLSVSENSYYNKLSGNRGFTEDELCILFDTFGKSIFFDNNCYVKRIRKEEK